MDLDNKNSWKTIDSLGVENALTLFSKQILNAWNQALKADIHKHDFDAIVVSGMGGSSNAGKIIEGVFANQLKIPFIVFNDYGLPKWVNEDTLVVANTYSGNTEETLSAVIKAKAVGAKIVGVTTGGKISEMIKNDEFEGIIVDPGETNPPNFPKSGLGVSLGALLGCLVKTGAINLTQLELEAALSEVDKIRGNWLSDVDKENNPAKSLAEWLRDAIPVYFTGRPLLGSLNAARNATDEIGRTFTLFFDFPEVNHVLVEATGYPKFIKEKIKYIFFESKFLSDRVKLRYEITKNLFDEQSLNWKSFKLEGTSVLVQGLELAHLGAWIGFYISILNNSDPGPEPWIIKLKEALS